jgi:hypothetical protein
MGGQRSADSGHSNYGVIPPAHDPEGPTIGSDIRLAQLYWLALRVYPEEEH